MGQIFVPNAEQEIISDLSNGKHLVVAPPGSGKTTLLSVRIEKALSAGIKPENMACLTFTTRAARNMKDKIEKLNIPNWNNVFIGNFHAFGHHFLKNKGWFPYGASIMDETDSHNLISEIKYDIDINNFFSNILYENYDSIFNLIYSDYKTFIEKSQKEIRKFEKLKEYEYKENIISMLRNVKPDIIIKYNIIWKMLKYDFPINVISSMNKEFIYENINPIFLKFYIYCCQLYDSQKERMISFDFDDLILSTLNFLYNNKQSQKFCWIQVDEVQDLNPLQWEIVKELSDDDSHIVLFGDINQTIFSFLGSSCKRLEKETKDYVKHSLTTNWRSPKHLVDIFNEYSHAILKQNFDWIPNENENENIDHFLLQVDTDPINSISDQITYIIYRVMPYYIERISNSYHQEIKKEGKSEKGKIAILFRSNSGVDEFSKYLKGANINYFRISQYDLFRYKLVKDFLSILDFLINHHNRYSSIRLIKLFGEAENDKLSRKIINELFESGINLSDLLVSYKGTYSLKELENSFNNDTIIIFDTETTGTDIYRDDIIQIAAIKIHKGEINDKLNLYIKTTLDLGESIKIHGITKEKLNINGLEASCALKTFYNFIENFPLIAHNIEFDIGMLKHNLNRHCKIYLEEKRPTFDTLSISRNFFPKLRKHKLEFLIKEFHLEGKNTHDALDDVEATFSLLKRLIVEYENRREKISQVIIDYDKYFINLKNNFSELYTELQNWFEQKNKKFSDAYTYIINYMKDKTPKYFEHGDEKIEEISNKLIKHMDSTCKNDLNFIDLLSTHLPSYKYYKEPDLILEDDTIVVSTVHRAKGLEFEAVIIPDCTDNKFPHYYVKEKYRFVEPASVLQKARSEEAILEEARLLFVAMSRAKKYLTITYGPGWYKDHILGVWEKSPNLSRFIRKISLSFTYYKIENYSPNLKIYHCNYCGKNFNVDVSKKSKVICYNCFNEIMSMGYPLCSSEHELFHFK